MTKNRNRSNDDKPVKGGDNNDANNNGNVDKAENNDDENMTEHKL